MKNVLLTFFLFLNLTQITAAKDSEFTINDLFHIDQMNSYNNNFALYFKTREKDDRNWNFKDERSQPTNQNWLLK